MRSLSMLVFCLPSSATMVRPWLRRTGRRAGWLLASGLWLLASSAYARETIVLEARGRIEARGEGKPPVAIIEGTTTLPDRAILRFSIYYDKIALQKELNYKRDHANKGAFLTEIDIQTGVLFPGTYWCKIDFDASAQYQTTREALGADLKPYAWEISFRVGSEEEARQAKESARQDLIGAFDTLHRIQKEVHEEYTSMMNKFDPKTWALRTQQWHQDMETATHLRMPLMVFKILSLDDVSTIYLEDLTESLNGIIHLSAAGLGDPKKSQQQWNQLNRTQYEFKKSYEAAMKRMGVMAISDDEIQKRLGGVVEVKQALVQAVEQLSQNRLADPEWKALRENWQPQFFNAVLALTEVAPDATYKKALEMIEAGQEANAVLQKVDAGPKAGETFRPLFVRLDAVLKEFAGLLDGTYRYPDPPQTENQGGHDHSQHHNQPDSPQEDKPHDNHPQ